MFSHLPVRITRSRRSLRHLNFGEFRAVVSPSVQPPHTVCLQSRLFPRGVVPLLRHVMPVEPQDGRYCQGASTL